MALNLRQIATLAVVSGTLLLGHQPWSAHAGEQATQVLRWPSERKRPVLTAIQMQPSGPLVAAAGDTHLIHIWNRETGEPKWQLKGHADWIRTLSIAPDGRTLASGGNDGRVILWDLESGKAQAELPQFNAAVRTLQFSASGAMLGVSVFGQPLRLYHGDTQELLFELPCPCQDVSAIAFSADDWKVAAAGRNGRLRVWNLKDSKNPTDHRPHRRRIRAIAMSDQGVITCGDDGRVVVSNESANPREVVQLPTKLFSLAVVDENRIAVGATDNAVRLLDLGTGDTLGTYQGHDGTVASICVCKEALASCGFDTTVRLWRLPHDSAKPLELETSLTVEDSPKNEKAARKIDKPADTSALQLAPGSATKQAESRGSQRR